MMDNVPWDIYKEGYQESVPARERVNETGILEELSTGAACIRRARKAEQLELARYHEDRIAVRGSCILCRTLM
jgi:hypothetical protein